MNVIKDTTDLKHRKDEINSTSIKFFQRSTREFFNYNVLSLSLFQEHYDSIPLNNFKLFILVLYIVARTCIYIYIFQMCSLYVT